MILPRYGPLAPKSFGNVRLLSDSLIAHSHFKVRAPIHFKKKYFIVTEPRSKAIVMTRSSAARHGFGGYSLSALRLKSNLAASFAIGSLSLCLIVTLTVLSIRVAAAVPLPL
jgi:hypothetical protein